MVSTSSNYAYTFAFPRPQIFPFPLDMILKIIQKPETSGKGFFKLLKTCKWFYWKGFIIPIGHLYYLENGRGWEASNPLDPSHSSSESFILGSNALIKIWVINALTISSNSNPTLISFLTPKLYRCDASLINIYNQTISFDDLKYFLNLPLVKDRRHQLQIQNVLISPMVEDSILLQNILVDISNVLSFEYTFGRNLDINISVVRGKNLPVIKKFPQDFIEYKINEISNNFDIEFILNFIKENPDINLSLNFRVDISNEYKDRLERFIENILKEYNNREFYPPIIKFQDQDVKKVCELLHFRKSYATSRQTME